MRYLPHRQEMINRYIQEDTSKVYIIYRRHLTLANLKTVSNWTWCITTAAILCHTSSTQHGGVDSIPPHSFFWWWIQSQSSFNPCHCVSQSLSDIYTLAKSRSSLVAQIAVEFHGAKCSFLGGPSTHTWCATSQSEKKANAWVMCGDQIIRPRNGHSGWYVESLYLVKACRHSDTMWITPQNC